MLKTPGLMHAVRWSELVLSLVNEFGVSSTGGRSVDFVVLPLATI